MNENSITITDAAANRIAAMAEKKGNPDLMLRITIEGGGCSGFQTLFKLDDQIEGDDLTFEKNGIKVVTDETSLELIKDSEIDFVDDLMGSRFQVNNPNAESMCGCGTSFSIKF
jgi:iron-sulfur cluster insertion protein